MRRAALLPSMLLLGAAALLLSACAVGPHHGTQRSGEVAATCKDKAQCDRLWARARDWVTLNSEQPVANATDFMILTRQPESFDARLSYRVARWAAPDESGEIRFEASCSPVIPCRPQPAQALAQFRAYIAAP